MQPSTNEEKPIAVSQHALIRANKRGHQMSAREIRDEVRDALRAGRIANNKPTWARLYKEKKDPWADNTRCVWNADQTRAWLIRRDEDREVVVTAIQRTIPKEA